MTTNNPARDSAAAAATAKARPIRSGGAGSPSTGSSIEDRVRRVINLLRPAVQADGGDLELLSVDDAGVVTVRLHGACVGCPSSSLTLQEGISRNLREHVPEVTKVRAID